MIGRGAFPRHKRGCRPWCQAALHPHIHDSVPEVQGREVVGLPPMLSGSRGAQSSGEQGAPRQQDVPDGQLLLEPVQTQGAHCLTERLPSTCPD